MPDSTWIIQSSGGIGINLDAALSTNEDVSATVTDHPVEDGVNVADHIRDEPDKFSIEGIVTNTPVELAPLLLTESSTRAEDAWQNLLKLMKMHSLVSVVTPNASYEDYAIESISRPRTAQIGEAAQFTIKFKKIVKVKATTAPGTNRASGTQGSQSDGGKISATPAANQGAV